ncbi:MAG TPA: sialidase domain-containing protein [Candidatus Paceibacterota bacterium]|nr:sialidase domain-containing protein [Verrucomicrobiota bacterium]HSA09624.1 sialidase domain-containing protein [Candidatus Paceibacterota bacterium]
MSKTVVWMSCLLFAWLAVAGVEGAQVQLAPGNGVWLKPAQMSLLGNEASVIGLLNAYGIKHVFLWATTNTSSSFPMYSPFIQQAHASGLTVHAMVAVKTTITNESGVSSALLQDRLNHVITYSANHPEAAFDGVQIDVEGVRGTNLLNLVAGVSVPETLVFSADVQSDEFYYDMEEAYYDLLQSTDMDLLIPMIYIMDGIPYQSGTNNHTFTIPRVGTKTDQLLALLPSQGRMMTGLSGYDMQHGVIKGAGTDSSLSCHGASNMAMGSGNCAVPHLLSLYPLWDVNYQSHVGVSVYRFDVDADSWLDVLEMTPIGLRRSIAAADQAGAGDARYLGTCTWLYFTTFDSTSGRREGLIADDGLYPSPNVRLEVLGISSGQARLRVTLTNANPSERVLGDHAAAGVHLRVEGGEFSSAATGTFHAAEGFDAAGNVLGNVAGAQIIELRRSFFEDPAAQQAQSGEIVVNAPTVLTVRYRAWMTDKDSICYDVGTAEPYIARSPDDVHYRDAGRFLTCATFVTNIVVSQSGAYAAGVLEDKPVSYHRFSEENVASVPELFTVANLGTVGDAGKGVAAVTNGDFATSILGRQPGALATAANSAVRFVGASDTNRFAVPYCTEWNVNGPFTVELWLKGGTAFSCPAASVVWPSRGWLIYQGNAAQTTGNGWYFRVYKTGSVAVTAQVDMTVNPNTWYHVVGVYDGANARLYVNGTLRDTAPLSGTYTPNIDPAYPLTLGARHSTNSWAYKGSMDEAAFYTSALSASQVAAHCAAATTNAAGYAAQVLAHNPAGYWRLDDGLTPPKAANSGSLGPAAEGDYLNWSTTVAELQSPEWPGLETTNRALQVCGTNGQVVVPALNLNTNAVTFECLIKRNGPQQNHAGLIMHRNADGGGASACGLGFRGAYSHLGYNWNDAPGAYTWDSGLTPPDGQWCYVALAVSATQAVLCMCDGTTWSTVTRMASHAVQPFAGLTRFGSDGGTNRWFNGLMDEVAIYKATLSQAQLRAHALAAFGNTNQPLFMQVPQSQTVELGSTVVLSAGTVGSPTILYQWQKDGVPLAGATGLNLTLTNVDYTDAGVYRLGATNGSGGVLSPAATLVVWPPVSVTNLTYRVSSGESGSSLELIWPAGTLYSADDLMGLWTIVSEATLPYYKVAIAPATPQKFFRAQ